MLIKYVCNNPNCNNFIKKYYKPKSKILGYMDCGACSIGKLERQLSAPTNNNVQYLDNGAQTKRVAVSDEVLEKERNKE